MKLKVQKRIAADVAGCSPKRIKFDETRLEDIKESITKTDIRGLINDGAIKVKQKKGVSRARANKNRKQRKKGRQKGHGSRKGSKNARASRKREWINKIRLQRKILKLLRDKEMITTEVYATIYSKAKGGFFRSKKHMQIYLEEHNLIKK